MPRVSSTAKVDDPSRSAEPLSPRATLAALLLALGCQAGPGEPRSLIVVTIDTLRADHLGCYGYFRDTSPNIDRFAADAVLFESAFAPMATTLPTHTSLFTGLFPLEHQVVSNVGASRRPFASRPGMQTLAEYAKQAGYTTAAFVSAAPVKRFSGIAAGFDVYEAPFGPEQTAAVTVAEASRWLADTPARPIFLWVHLYDPHRPLEPPPEHDVFSADEALERHLAERRVPAETQMDGRSYSVREDVDRYDGEIRFTDDRFGALLGVLRETGLYDDSVIVLTADHGEGLNQHDWPDHGGTWVEQLQVPLVMRFPDERLNRIGRVTSLVSTVDILPTALPHVDPALAERFAAQASGVDVLAPGFAPRALLSRRSAGPGRKPAGPLYSLTTPEWRLLLEPNESELLFHRARDPFELEDQAAAHPEVVDALRSEAAALIGAQTARATALGVEHASEAAPLDPELLRQLEALGYATE